jgi:hypothetical protein
MRPVELAGVALVLVACATNAAAQAPQGQINTLNELGAALRACWIPPSLDRSRAGMQLTVQMSFRRNGELFGKPKITFKRCASLPFTDALGNAVAGRPFTMRLVDDRKLKQAENAP